MPSTVEQLSPTRAKLVITIPFDDLTPALTKAYKQIASQVNIPGFRKGKVPNSLIDQRFGRGAVLQEAINEALPDAYAAAVREHQLVPLGQPEIDVTRLEDGELVEFTAEVDVRPEFEVADATQVEVEVDAVELTEEAVQERLDLLRQRFATFTDLDRPVAEGDYVEIDLAGSRNGEPLPDAEGKGMTYRVGAGGMVEGLDEALTGLSVGESATFSSTLVGGQLKDQPADITVTVRKVQEQQLPEVDDEFAGMISEFDTVEEMMTGLRDTLARAGRIEQAGAARDAVLERIVELSPFELPEALVEGELSARREQVENQLTQLGMTVEEYLAESEDEDAEDAEQFWKQIEDRSVRALRAQVILDKVADDQQIGVNQQELTSLIIQKAQQNGTSPEQEANHMMEHNHMSEWMSEIRRGKALGSLVNAAKVTDSKGEHVELALLASDGTIREPADVEQAAADSTPEAAETETD